MASIDEGLVMLGEWLAHHSDPEEEKLRWFGQLSDKQVEALFAGIGMATEAVPLIPKLIAKWESEQGHQREASV